MKELLNKALFNKIKPPYPKEVLLELQGVAT